MQLLSPFLIPAAPYFLPFLLFLAALVLLLLFLILDPHCLFIPDWNLILERYMVHFRTPLYSFPFTIPTLLTRVLLSLIVRLLLQGIVLPEVLEGRSGF